MINKNAFRKITGLTSVKMPSTMETIGEGAFADCTKLESVIIPSDVESNLTEIKSSAFKDCGALKEIDILAGVTKIGDSAFSGCGLVSVSLPISVNTIGNNAFEKCTALKDIEVSNFHCNINVTGNAIPSTATIRGYENSKAQEYAKANGNTFDSMGYIGDANGDSSVDIADVVAIAAYVGDPKTNVLSDEAVIHADVHNIGNGITADDALMIQQFIANMITEF